jgi:hypothetical protein
MHCERIPSCSKNEQSGSSILHTVPIRLVPAGRALFPRFSGDHMLITPPRRIAVVARSVEPCGATVATLVDDGIASVDGGFERFAVVPGFVGAGRAGITLAGDGGLGIRKAGECVNRY